MKNINGVAKKIMDSNNLDDLKSFIDYESNTDLFNKIFDVLNYILKTKNVEKDFIQDRVFYLLYLLESIIIDGIDVDINNKLIKLKNYLIKKIKVLSKENRFKDKEVLFLKEVTNKVENLELNLQYNTKESCVVANYNIIKQVVLKEKNIEYVKTLIDKYSYLINAYNLSNNNNIFNIVVDELLDSLDEYSKNNSTSDLYYFNDVLEILLLSPDIKRSEELIEKNIRKIIKKSENQKNLNKKGKIISWYNHLVKELDYPGYKKSLEEISNLYNFRDDFNISVYEECELLKRDFRQKICCNKDKFSKDYIISIDGDDTYDKDDALSIKKVNDNFFLTIFISDPFASCPINSLVMNEARNRSQTLYLPDKIIPMIPSEVVRKNLSLDENKNRFVRSYKYIIDKYGEILDFKIEKEVIRVSNNLTFSKANKIIKSNSNNPKLEETMSNLLELKDILSKKYDVAKIVDEVPKSNSEKLIETFMKLNNYSVAKYFSDNNLPFVYRHHKLKQDFYNKCPIDFDMMNKKDENNYGKILNSFDNICLSASYSMYDSYHEGLNLDFYCNSTCPIRRYADNLVNFCQDNFYYKTPTDKQYINLESQLKKEVDFLNEKDKETLEYYKEYIKYRN